jgi:hypothetical protein
LCFQCESGGRSFRTIISIENPLRRGEMPSLSGLNLRIDARTKQLVDAGPIVAAVA